MSFLFRLLPCLPTPAMARLEREQPRECRECRRLQPDAGRTPPTHQLPDSRWGWAAQELVEQRYIGGSSSSSSSSSSLERVWARSPVWSTCPWVPTQLEALEAERRWRRNWYCADCWASWRRQEAAKKRRRWMEERRQQKLARERWQGNVDLYLNQRSRYEQLFDRGQIPVHRSGDGWMREGDPDEYATSECLTPRYERRQW